MNCKENYYELIGSIEIYPDSAVTFGRPFNMEKKSDRPDFTPQEDRKLVLPMKKKSGSLKETPSVSVSGESYEVVVSWEVEEVNQETYAILESLKTDTNHLMVKSFIDGEIFIRAIPGAHSFEYSESNGVLECELTINNLTGAQRIA